MHHQNPYAASDRKSLAMPESGRAPGPSSLYPLVMKTAPGGKQRLRFSNTCMKRRNWGTVPVDDTHAPPMTAHPRKRKRESNEPLTAGGRELRLTARPPARFSSLRSPRLVNQKQESSGNTLLAQRYPLPGNRYLWRTTSLRAEVQYAFIFRTGSGAQLSRMPQFLGSGRNGRAPSAHS